MIWTFSMIPALATEAEKEVINRIFIEAAEGFELKCGRQYDFGTAALPLYQTTELNKLQPKKSKNVNK